MSSRRAKKAAAWGGSLVLVVVALLAAPFLVPLEGFVPELSRLASEKLGQPVSIGELRLHMLPTPRGVAKEIVVGKRREVLVGELQIVPELLSLVSGPPTIRLILASDIVLKEAALAIPGHMPKGPASGEEVRIRAIELRKVKLLHPALRLPEFNLHAELGEGLVVEQAELHTTDGAVSLQLTPQGGGLSKVLMQAKAWTLPAGPPLRLDELMAQGTLKGDRLDLPAISGRLYGGQLSGAARAEWGRLWQISGKASLDGVDLVPLQRDLGKKAQLSGRLKSEATFTARGRTPEQLQNSVSLDGPFQVFGGEYHGYDLSKMSVRQLEAGGSTRFDQLTGQVQVRGREVRVTELCARSPSLAVGGNVTIAPDAKLSGKLDVSVTQTGGFVGIPVSLGGTTAEPSFSPTKGYVIGATIGTLLLPGIGTSIGASAGSRIEGGTSGCK